MRRAALLWLIGMTVSAGSVEAALSSEAVEAVRPIAIQHNGRHKPFDSFARETLDHITGEPRLGREDPLETVLSIIANPEPWQVKPLLWVPFGPLREQLGMDPKASHVSYHELISTRKLMRMLPAIAQKQQREEKLTMLEQETWDVYERFVALSALFDQNLELVPPQSSSASQVWLPIFEASFQNGWTSLTAAVREGRHEDVISSARELSARLRQANPTAYPASWRLQLEVWYNRAGLFGWARLLYAL
ncbi:MAG: hypothetical protein HYZ92_04800, partial [Candidatus Omnitrophica bacterium]|nr:hypothetical protein [Candidatus Omnitrophota bacterium]